MLAGQFLVDLDAVYSKVVAPGWLVVVSQASGSSTSSPSSAQALATQSVFSTTRSDYGISAKITRVALTQPTNPIASLLIGLALEEYYQNTRTISVIAQSDELDAAEQPLTGTATT